VLLCCARESNDKILGSAALSLVNATVFAAHQYVNTRELWFNDVLRLNGYPEGNIDQTKHSQNHHKDPRPLNTEWSYLKIHISPNVSTTGSLTLSEKRVYQYGSRTSHTSSDELSLTTTRNGHVQGPTALSPAANCAYYATLFTKSRVTTATNTTLGALHALSTIV